MVDLKAMDAFIQRSGLKQSWIAEQVGMSQNALTLSLNEKRKMKVDEYVSICGVLGVSLDKFVVNDQRTA